jgi:hypothetical protein
MVPPDTRLPGGWNISADGYLVPPLSRGKDLEQLITRATGPKEDRVDPSFRPKSELWKMMLDDKWKVRIDVFDGPMCPSQYNKIGHHAWWDGRDYDEVMARWWVGLSPPSKRPISTPNPTGLSSSSRSATSRRSSSSLASMPPQSRRGLPGISFRVPKEEPPSPHHRPSKKPTPGVGPALRSS